jgi:gamma-D-glutamyl-L-lysine dipeptidyl-peptidase
VLTRVAVTTLWTDPSAVRDVDSPAVADRPDVRAWAGSLSPEQRDDLDGRTLTQLLLGERVLVEEERDGWARVVALDQPAGKLDPRGYPGWLRLSHVSMGAQVPPTHVVCAAATALRDAPDGDVVLPGVTLGTRLAAVDLPVRGWLPVAVPGRDAPAWARAQDLASSGTVLDTAALLLDVRYVWGGLSAYGVDCSGLVHLAHRRHGVTLPRDADDQHAATQPVPLGSERAGDLYFFARPGRPVHHVGFVVGPRQMLHACGTKRRVVREPLTEEREATLVAAHRVVP